METVDGNAAGSRWNPTKEQITMLEGLYKQGIRTPSADQIQQITTRLQAYGHIEGKNVFYWFQNHKARQRQKQKQESMVYFNHFLQRTPPIFIPPPPPGPPYNNVCNPYYIPVPQHGIGYYPQYPKVPLQTNARRRKKIYNDGEKRSRSYNEGEKANGVIALGWNQKESQPNIIMNKSGVNEEIMNTTFNGNETLALFPLYPTGILDEKSSRNCIPTSSAENPNPCHSFENGIEECSGDQPFFNFFGSKVAD